MRMLVAGTVLFLYCSVARAGDGPDVIVSDIDETRRWASVNGISAYSIGTESCNIGNEDLNWFRNEPRHPVIAQNMYRLKEGRFEQIGQSWLKHGFYAVNSLQCSNNCPQPPPPDGEVLRPLCSDPYNSNLNGMRELQPPPRGGGGLGPRSEVNPVTGVFPWPYSHSVPWNQPLPGALDRRLQVHNEDLDPGQNAGAKYFVEGHYVTQDDADSGNDLNNASYRPVNVSGSNGNYLLSFAGFTQQQLPAIQAWQDFDPQVTLKNVDIEGDGRFIVAYKASINPNRTWHYEYAVANFNSHRAAFSFEVPVSPDAVITNVEFNDVDSHSGDGEQGGEYSNVDWSVRVTSESVKWSTETFDQNINANALRWGTMYTFRFDAEAGPGQAEATLGLFRPGDPASVVLAVAAPGGEGAIPCDDIKRLTAKCKNSGTVKAAVKFKNSGHEGKLVTIQIADVHFDVPVQRKSAKATHCCYNGDVAVSLLNPPGCVPDQRATCPPQP